MSQAPAVTTDLMFLPIEIPKILLDAMVKHCCQNPAWIEHAWREAREKMALEATPASVVDVCEIAHASEPEAPEAPCHYDASEASAWQSGWGTGYAAAPLHTDDPTPQPADNEFTADVFQGLMTLSKTFRKRGYLSVTDDLESMAMGG